ncbi:MAG TPA: CopD family protein [Gemmatimonadaceae bacterium]|jgi:copper transport protein|nr:CopD family protein [Gemmatimonadaceae bacterium]
MLNWSEPALELISFLGSYLAIGVIGFRYGVLGRARASDQLDDGREGIFLRAASRAALLGLLGTIISTVLLLHGAMNQAAAKHLTMAEVLTAGQGLGAAKLGLYAVALVGFALCAARSRIAWSVTGVAVIIAALINVFTGRWATLVNPVHVLAGSLWIGTLFVLMAIGLPAVLASSQSGSEKARTVADLVNAYSPMALVSVAVLAISGVVTAWRHLKYVAALWTTSYGFALIVKLCVVVIVLALGAWNWRRVRPSLGTEAATGALRRSATAELAFAGLVLLITSVLVSLPSPKLPH